MPDATTSTSAQELSDSEALERIRRILRESHVTNWGMPDKYALDYAQKISRMTPSKALKTAQDTIEDLQKKYEERQQKAENAKKFRANLKENPITNLGKPGLGGYIRRQLLAMLNGTPTSLNTIEVDDKGLQVYTPLALVSRRTYNHTQIKSGEIQLSIDPPIYFDRVLGLLNQFKKGYVSPWGEINVTERGSNKTIASAIAWQPDKKIAEMRRALEIIHFSDNPYENFERMPRLVDLLIYYDPERIVR